MSTRDAEDDDGGRTVVKPEQSVGRAVRRKATPSQVPATTSNSTSVSPAAVIRKTQDSMRVSQRPGMLAPPPADPVEDNEEYTQVPPARSSRREGPSLSVRSNYPPSMSSPPMSYEGPPSHRPPPRSERSGDIRSDSTRDSSRRQPESYDDDVAPPRSYAPPPNSSARNDHFARSAPPSSGRSAQSQMPYQQTMDVTGESGNGNHYQADLTGPPPGQHDFGGMYVDHTTGMPGAPLGGHPGHGMPAHMMNHMSAPPAPMSSHPAAMPAHFRLAQTGAITPQMEVPPRALTASNLRPSSRPAISWAMALAAAGVFVGVVAVAITQREPAADAQAPLPVPAQPAAPAQPQATVATTNALPPGLLGASPAGQSPNLLPSLAPVPGMGDPGAAPAGGPVFAPVPVTKAPRVGRPKAPTAPRQNPGPKAGDDDDDDAPPKKAAAAATSKKGPKDPDEETRKALEALQKAQLESSSKL